MRSQINPICAAVGPRSKRNLGDHWAAMCAPLEPGADHKA
jgi:hypothetical protein